MSDITWTNVRVTLGDLEPWEHNPRQLTAVQAERLDDSIETFGQVETIAIGPDGDVYNGHQRLAVLLDKHGKGFEVDARQSSRELTFDERKQLTIYLHEGATGDWNFDLLANIFDVDELTEWGFPEWKIEEFMPSGNGYDEGADAEPQIDRAEELREQWGVELGQLWKLGEHRVICGDCTDADVVERVMGREKGHLIFTDPPYGVAYNGGAKKREELKSDHIGTDIYYCAIPLLASAVDDRAALYLWYADGHAAAAAAAAAAAGYQIVAQIIWAKNHAQFVTSAHYKGKHEPCYYAHKKNKSARWHGDNNEVTLWEYDRANSNDYHPTQKPVPLAVRAIKNSTETGHIVLDGFIGGGTTLIACENLHRRCRGIEISPAYVAVTLQRWHDLTGEMPELVDEPVIQVETS